MNWDRAVALRRALLGLTLLLAVPGVAHAATVTNTSDSGPGSLRDAIANPGSANTVDFSPSLNGQTITLLTPLGIGQSLTIAGPGPGLLTINGGGHGTVFDIDASASTDNVTISGLTITGGAFTATGSNAGGGGIFAENVNTLTLISDAITGNQATISAGGDSGGGGVYMDGGNVSVTGSTISGNTATVTGSSGGDSGGGGLYSAGGSVALTGSNVTGNTVEIDSSTGDNGGGGIYSAGGDVVLIADTVDGNKFTLPSDDGGDNGGAGVYSAGGDIDVDASSISANIGNVTSSFGDNGGGGIYNAGGTSTYVNSTLSANSMTVTGGTDNGGGAMITFGDTTASDVTFAGNSINQPGGAISGDASVDLQNTILADNTATPAGNCDRTFGTFSSGGFNLESTDTCGLNATGDLVNTEPLLGPLQNNGGPTPTQALPAGSPAVDAGSCTDFLGNPLTTDQRGTARPQPVGGKCDIGAYELAPTSAPPNPPLASPGTPAATSSTGASFSGSVNPQGQLTTVFFQYGIDSRLRPGGGTGVVYDQSTPPQTLPADSIPHPVSASAAGLVPNALYHVRLVAQNATGTTLGPDQTFTTLSDPAPPAPVLGQKINATPVSGQVFVLVAGKLVPLTEGQQLPSGATVDARDGTLQLTAAATKGHKRESGVFGGAIFKLTQLRTGLTTLAIREGAFAGAPSYATCKAPKHRAAGATAAAVSSKTLQLLHASAKGKFRTTGRYSAATVRGTRWSIADRCDGTLTKDISHSVAVTDFVRHKTIVLHAGQSYLAKARRRGK